MKKRFLILTAILSVVSLSLLAEGESKTFPRTVVLEEFTTEKCLNCPTGATTIKNAISALSSDEQARVAMVTHHSGYYTDDFTLQCDVAYTRLYGNGGTFCPAYMLDREGTAPVSGISTNASSITSRIKSRLNVPAHYSVAIDGEVNTASLKVKLNIEIEKGSDYLETPYIVVFLVEDDVLASNNGSGQANGGSNYHHSHVKRAYNKTWGEEVKWDENGKFSYSCMLDYTEECNIANMEVLAMVYNYGKTDVSKFEVGNAAKRSFNDMPKTDVPYVAVDNVLAENIAAYSVDGTIRVDGEYDRTEVFDLSGRKVENCNLNKGIYIVKIFAGDAVVCKKVMVK